MTMLQIDNLCLDIHGTEILHDISLSVGPGEILAVTGESGSGKSLTALAALQLLPQGATMRGQITLADRPLSDLTEAELCARRGRDIGMVFQEPMTALNPVQTIGAQVAETVRQHHHISRRAARLRAEETLVRVGLSPDRCPPDRYPHQLSGGQRQRVVIAIAIVLGPQVLVADEPTTALDVTTQAQILQLLARLAREDGMGLMLITHDLAVVAQHADRIAVMRHGAIVETGTARAVLSNPQHAYTQSLLRAATRRVELPPRTATTPLLSVQNLSRSYRMPRRRLLESPQLVQAVHDVSFDIQRGERVGLVGESGCGKSTLTRAILGLEPLQSGRVTLAGTAISPDKHVIRAARRHMQVVFQDPFGSFNPRHKVRRLICEPLHLLDTAPSENERNRMVDEALFDVGLTSSDADRYIHEFSGGQRQRIAIARALLIKPDLVIFDEAVSALDVSVRRRILDLIALLSSRHGLTYLFISHDLSVVRSVTDRVMVMQAGKIVEEGSTHNVFTNPRHPYTRKLVAAVPHLDTTELPH